MPLAKSVRSAFTLIELLIVIAIGAIIMSLTTAAVFKVVEIQQGNDTKVQLTRLQLLLSAKWRRVSDEANREPIPPLVQTWIQQNLAGSDANAAQRIRIVYVKLRLRQAFPMTFDEALNKPASPLSVLPEYQRYLSGLGVTGSTPSTRPVESSACLAMILRSEGYDGNAYPTDAWGHPIYFTRVPTSCPAVNPGGPQTGAMDACDPQGYLQSPGWKRECGNIYQALTQEVLTTDGASFKYQPVLASGGPIGKNDGIPLDLATFLPLKPTVMYSVDPN